MDLITSFTNNVVNKAMNGHSARHVTIASNLANVDTPGYAKKTVHFEDQLQQAIAGHHQDKQAQQRPASNDEPLAMRGTNARHIGASPMSLTLADVTPEVQENDDYMTRNDKNAVDVEVEMVELAENTQHYLALTNLQGRMMRSTRTVISNSGN